MNRSPARPRAAGLVLFVVLAAPGPTYGDDVRAAADRLATEAGEQARRPGEAGLRQALDLYERSLALWVKAGAVLEEAQTLNQMGILRRRLGETAAAVELYGKALALFRGIGDRAGEANALNNLGRAYAELDRLDLAGEHYQQALVLWRALEDPQQASTLRNLGQLLVRQGKHAAALERFREALAASRRQQDRVGEGSSLNSIGDCQLALGEIEAAEGTLRSALDLARLTERIDLEAAALSNLGHVRRRQGDLGTALEHFLEALDLFRRLGQPVHVATALQNLGTVYVELGQLRRALDVYPEAQELYRSAGSHSAAARVALSASWVRITRGEVAEAIAELERLRAERHAAADLGLEAEVLGALGFAYLAAGRPGEARGVLERALGRWRETGERPRQAAVLAYLGKAWAALGDADRAAASFSAVLGLGPNLGAEATSLHGLARLERDRGRLDAALELSQKCLAVIEGRRQLVPTPELRATFLAGIRPFYELHVDLLIRLHERDPRRGFDAAAFEASERARARGLLDLLAERGEQRYGKPVGLGEIRELLAPETALLEYVLGDEGALLFVVTRRGVRSWRLDATAPRIASQVEELRAALAGGGRRRLAAYRSAAWSLYQTLVEPAVADLGGVEQLVVVPDGSLHYLPFEALLTAAPAGGAADPGPAAGGWPYLLKRWPVSYAPSASVLASLAGAESGRRPAPGPALVAFGDPSYGDAPGGLPRLAGSAREVAAIAALYPSSQVALYLGREAREENVESDVVRWARRLHFATHALLDERRPQLSALALARGDDSAEDGLLQVHEIARLDLAAELVVLSACETALGEDVRGEGLTGLARAFLYAGAPRVVVSLWRVDDAATVELMTRFYRALEGRGTAAALHAAKLELLAEGRFAHPAHWAAFVLIGRP